MTRQQQIADFLVAAGYAPPADPPASWIPLPARTPFDWRYPQPPTVEELAHELLQMGEFQALRLGTWLGTTDGEIITGAVTMAIPPYLRPEIELLVAGLMLAARLQQHDGQRAAGRVALVVIGLVALTAMAGTWGFPKRR